MFALLWKISSLLRLEPGFTTIKVKLSNVYILQYLIKLHYIKIVPNLTFQLFHIWNSNAQYQIIFNKFLLER